MLSNLGYFRSIACPGLLQEGECKRPFCHFRHSNASSNTKRDEVINASVLLKNHHEIDHRKSQRDDDNEEEDNCSMNDDDENHLPYTPYNGAAKLYKPFKAEAKKVKTIDHSKFAGSQFNSVLHGARGPTIPSNFQSSTKKRRVNYSVSSTSKPKNDLEYDPMCNFNLKTKKNSQVPLKEVSTEINSTKQKDVVVEDSPSTDLIIIDDDSGEASDDNAIPEVSKAKDPTVKNIDKQSVFKPKSEVACKKDDALRIKSDDVTIVISDSEDDSAMPNVNHFSQKLSEKGCGNYSSENGNSEKKAICKKDSSELLEDFFGMDNDNDEVSAISQKKSSVNKSLNAKEKQTSTVLSFKANEDERKKSSKNLNKVKSEKSKKARKRKLNENISLAKNKKLKIKSPNLQSDSDVSKYVDKEEIASLDKDLSDESIFHECYKIYQESFQKIPSRKSSSENSKNASMDEKGGANQLSREKEADLAVAQRSKRVARSFASDSASLLNRTGKQVRKMLTPAQKMMQRIEMVQQEQEEKILSAALNRKSSTSASSDNSRRAHRPSASLNKTSLSLSRKHLLASRTLSCKSDILTKKRPFQDLRRSSQSTTSTTQSTLGKGYQRVAHASTNNGFDKNEPEKPKILPDRHSKIPTNVRQRYLTVFIDECLRIFNKDRIKAYEMAKMEETQCSSRSKSKTIYLSLAASTLKKLRAMKPATIMQTKAKLNNSESQTLCEKSTVPSSSKVVFKSNTRRISHGISAAEAAKLKDVKKTKSPVKKAMSHKNLLDKSTRLCKGGYSFTKKEEQKELAGDELYESMCRYIMTEEELASNGFPRPGDIPGQCKFLIELPKLNSDKTKKTCARCGKEFVLYKSGTFARTDDECLHHWGRAYSMKVGSNWEKRYSCCQVPIGGEGCSVGETHVHKDNTYNCQGYVKTLWDSSLNDDPGVFALDCEMAFTVEGLELIRVSVVDFDCKLVYDTLVKPAGKILDYNTRWSGLSEEDLKGVTTTLRDVQAVLLSKFSSDTIFLGHSLESDLKALRIIHSSVVDTSIVFPHRLGPPYKRALRNLMSEHLGIIIQNCVDEGHDSTEDASACVKLMKWKLSEDSKVAR